MSKFTQLLDYLNEKRPSKTSSLVALNKSKGFQGPLQWLKWLIFVKLFQKNNSHLSPDVYISTYFTKIENRDYWVGISCKDEALVSKISHKDNSFRTNLLMREAVISKFLTTIMSPLRGKNGWTVSIAPLLDIINDDEFFGICFQKVNGVSLNNINTKLYPEIYADLMEYMQTLNQKIGDKVLFGGFSSLNRTAVLFTGMFYALLAYKRDYSAYKTITRSAVFLLTNISRVSSPNTLAHRDLYGDNVLIDLKNKKIYILDWQLAIALEELGEMSNIISTSRYDHQSKLELISRFPHNKTLVVYFLLQKLSGDYFSQTQRLESLLLLKTVLDDQRFYNS